MRIQVGEEECILLSESLIDFYYHWFSSIFSINIGRSKLSIEQIPLKFLSLCKNLDSNIELIADMKQDLLSLFVEKSLFISMEFERKTVIKT